MKQITFDYGQLDTESGNKVQAHADRIRVLAKQTAENIIEIGQRLAEVQDILPHGSWLPWLHDEFGWGQATAYNFIHVYQRFHGKLTTVVNLNIDVGALYDLAAPKLPAPVRDEAMQMAESGERVTRKTVKDLQSTYREVEQASPEIKEAVDSGEVGLQDAHTLLEQKISKHDGPLTVSDIKRAAKEAALGNKKLPSPKEAIEQSKQTGQMVVGSDGKLHGYVSPEQEAEQQQWSALREGLASLAAITTPPESLLKTVPYYYQPWVSERLASVHAWLNQFHQQWEDHHDQ